MLSVKSESVICEYHANEITESGRLDSRIESLLQKFAAGLDSDFVRYVCIE